MKKITFLKTMLVAIALLTGNVSAGATACDKSDDFSTLTASSSYVESTTTTNGWIGANASIFQGGTTSASSTWAFIGPDNATKAFTINGKTTTVGSITSPTFTGGCGTLSFFYGNAFSETNGAKVTIQIKQNGSVVWSDVLINTSAILQTKYQYINANVNVSGDYTLVITNSCPSNSTSNKDRLSIWGLCMTNYPSSTPTAATPTFGTPAGTYYAAQSVTLSSTTSGAKIYYTTDGTDPNNTGNGTLFSSAIALNTTANTTIKAIAYDATDANPSSVSTAVYAIYTTPVIVIPETSVSSMYAIVGNTQTKTINVSGYNLTGDVSLIFSGSNANQFSASPATVAQTSGTAANTAISIVYTPTSAGVHAATLTVSSAGATDKVFSLAATSEWPALATPIAIDATGISTTGFAANWNEVVGSTEYTLNAYTKSGTKLVEGFDAGSTAPTDWTFTAIGATYISAGNYGKSSPSIKFDATGDAITTPVYTSPATGMSFWLKGQTTTGSLLVEGWNGTSWVTIDNLVNPSNTATVYLYDASSTPALPANITQFRFTYSKTTSNLAFDDFAYMNNYVETPVIGSPFTVTGAITKEVGGLNINSTYYYTVIAKNTNVTSSVSNEITVSTLSTGLANPETSLNIIAAKGSIKLTATAGETIEIYNAVGQKLVHQLATEGVNTIPVSARGVVLVKVAGKITKVIM